MASVPFFALLLSFFIILNEKVEIFQEIRTRKLKQQYGKSCYETFDESKTKIQNQKMEEEPSESNHRGI